MSEVYIVEPYGVSDDVIDYFSGKEYNNGDHMAVAIVESRTSIKAGKSACADRRANGFSFPFESRIEKDNFANICRIPVCALWNKYISHKDVARCRIKVRIDVNEFDLQRDEKHIDVYADEILALHIEHLVNEFRAKYKIRVNRHESAQLIIPIPNELTEYCQEYLIRSLKRKGFEVIFIWRQVASLMQFMKSRPHNTFFEGQKIKVAYIGEDSLESCVFRVKEHKGVLVPVRDRPVMKKSLLGGFDYADFTLKKYFQSINRFDYCSDKVLWQIFNTRPDAWQSVCGMTPDKTLLPLEGKKLELFPSIKCNLDVKAQFSRSVLFSRALSLPDTDIHQSLLDFTLSEESGEYDAVLVCGDIVNDKISSVIANYAKNLNKIVWYSADELVLGGCSLYKHNLDNNLPTYLDSLPPLEILYAKDQEFEWATLVGDDELIEGGKEFISPEPFEKLAIQNGSNKLPVYLRVEALDPDDDGIHFEEKRMDKVASSDVRLSITVSMKPAFGLAKVTLKDKQKFLPVKGYNFDYSTMKKGTLPKLELAYPLELKMQVLRSNNDNLLNVARALHNRYISTYEFIDQLDLLKRSVADTSSYINKYYKNFDIDLNAGSTDNQQRLNDCLNSISMYCNKSNVLAEIKTNSTLFTALSHLFKGSPDAVKRLIKEHIYGISKIYGVNKFFYPACRTMYESEDDIKAIFAYFVGLKREARNKIYIANGLTWLLKYVPLSKNCLDEKTACAMVELSRDMFLEGVEKRNYKQKFVGATLILLYSLKYRANDNSFMTLDYKYADYYRKQLLEQEIYSYIETAVKALDMGRNSSDSVYERNYKDKLLHYEREIKNFIDKRGNQDFIIELGSDD